MSSINSYFTMNYVQPEEYHFSHDSVFLARFVFEWLQTNPHLNLQSIADFCSGCGIIGLDFLIHLNQNQMTAPNAIDFVEVQSVYQKYFQQNVAQFQNLYPSQAALNFIPQNYADLSDRSEFQEKYDLILCNPPYFQLGQGKLSPSDFKNRCRFYIDSNFENLMKTIRNTLKVGGVGFVLLRSLKDHKIVYDLEQLAKDFEVDLEIADDIRGTDVLKIVKKEQLFNK